MIYDCVIIGGGLAGLTCGIRCAEEGFRTVVISGGMNSLHFSSGSIDLAGFTDNGSVIKKPFEHLKTIADKKKDHPYAKTGLPLIRKSLEFFAERVSEEGITLNHNSDYNHFHVTAIGAVKPTYLSQESVFSTQGKELIKSGAKVAILNFKGFRDYYPEQTAAHLKGHPLFANSEFILGNISLPYYHNTEKNLHEFRSIDIARIFETERYLPRIADEIRRAAADADAVSLPAFIGINNYREIRRKLESMTGKFIYEIPTLPPSILGLRIDHAVKNSFFRKGGEYIAGEKIESAVINKGLVESIMTGSRGTSSEIKSRYYVLASGSFFSGGLQSGVSSIREPVFNLKVRGEQKRNRWYSRDFFDRKSHPFLSFGVETDSNLNPYTAEGKTVKNLFCAGSVLAGYNPVKEGCGGGVAISTGYKCAEKIIRELKK